MDRPLIEVLDLLEQLEELLVEGSRLPFSSVRMVNEDEAIELIDALRASLPAEFSRSDQLLHKADAIVNEARQQADALLEQARGERQQLLQSSSIRAEAERRAQELIDQARQQAERSLEQSRQAMATRENQAQQQLRELEQQSIARREQLEQAHRAQQQKLEQDLVQQRQQIQEDGERLWAELRQCRQQTKAHCEQLLCRSRDEATTLQQGADRYAERVLGELEQRMQEINQTVVAGRRELIRLRNQPHQVGSGVAQPRATQPLSQRELLRRRLNGGQGGAA